MEKRGKKDKNISSSVEETGYIEVVTVVPNCHMWRDMVAR